MICRGIETFVLARGGDCIFGKAAALCLKIKQGILLLWYSDMLLVVKGICFVLFIGVALPSDVSEIIVNCAMLPGCNHFEMDRIIHDDVGSYNAPRLQLFRNAPML